MTLLWISSKYKTPWILIMRIRLNFLRLDSKFDVPQSKYARKNSSLECWLCFFAYFCGGHKNNSRLWFRSSFKYLFYLLFNCKNLTQHKVALEIFNCLTLFGLCLPTQLLPLSNMHLNDSQTADFCTLIFPWNYGDEKK